MLCLLAFGDAFGYALILPVLPPLAERLGLAPLAIGLVFASYSACQLLAAPALGHLGDRLGPRPVLLACQAGTAAGFALLFGVASPWVLLASRIVDGATAGNVALLYGTVLKALPEARWLGGFGALATATSAGILAGLVGAALVVEAGFDLLVAVVVACSLLILLITALAFPRLPATRDRAGAAPNVPAGPAPFRAFLGGRGPRTALAAVIVATTLQGAFLSTLPLLLPRLLAFREAQTGRFLVLLFLVAGLCQVAVLPALGRRLSPVAGAAAAFAAAIVGGGVFALPRPAAVVGGAIVLMASCALLGPTLTTVLSRFSTARREGALMGVNQTAVSLGQLLGPLAGYALLALGTTVPSRLLLPALGALGAGLLLGIPRSTTEAPLEAHHVPDR